jgi:hypothetical protein
MNCFLLTHLHSTNRYIDKRKEFMLSYHSYKHLVVDTRSITHAQFSSFFNSFRLDEYNTSRWYHHDHFEHLWLRIRWLNDRTLDEEWVNKWKRDKKRPFFRPQSRDQRVGGGESEKTKKKKQKICLDNILINEIWEWEKESKYQNGISKWLFAVFDINVKHESTRFCLNCYVMRWKKERKDRKKLSWVNSLLHVCMPQLYS